MTKREVQEAIKVQMEAFNDIMPNVMDVVKADDAEWYTLHIDNVQITQGNAEHVLKRIKGINRENGI